jgi:hypothetical protein
MVFLPVYAQHQKSLDGIIRPIVSLLSYGPETPYLGFLKIALKIKIKAIPPIHITKRTSGVIYFIACMYFLH